VHRETALSIGGAGSTPSTEDAIEVISPHTEAPIAQVAAAAPADVNAPVAAARTAFDDGPWSRLNPSQRVDALRRLAEL
jgi:acyl-CoA reductase-like NAD-dependent aldehyde dehydrogenase